jgi:hypothetical protein
MTTEINTPAHVPGLPGALAHLCAHEPGTVELAYRPVDGRGLFVDVRPERRRERDALAGYAELAVFRWLAAVRDLGLLPLALDARLTASALTVGTDAPVLRRDDVAALVDRIRGRIETVASPGTPFPDILIRVQAGEHQVRVTAANSRVLAIREALAAEVAIWLAVHGSWWDSCGTLAVKLEGNSA